MESLDFRAQGVRTMAVVGVPHKDLGVGKHKAKFDYLNDEH